MLLSCLLFNDQNSIKKNHQNNIAPCEYPVFAKLGVKIIPSIDLYLIVSFRRQEAIGGEELATLSFCTLLYIDPFFYI